MPRPSYDPVANPNFSPDSNISPDPNRNSSFLDPEANNLFGRPGSEYAPAPSLMSRDSTAASMNLAGGTPSLAGTHRDSWGSGVGLTGAEGATNGNRNPGRSGLAHSTVAYESGDRLSTSEEDDEQGHITPAVAAIGAGTAARGFSEKPRWADHESGQGKKNRKWLWAALAALLIVAIGLGVGLGVGLTRNKDSKSLVASAGNENSSSQAPSGTSSVSGSTTATSTSATASATPTTGTQGSLITLEDGSTMTYDNPYGGKWVWDEANPFNNEAQANSWTPALNQNWTWGQDKVFGVNLGGWLVTEPFIVPGLYEKYANGSAGTAIDEYTLSINMGDNLTDALTEHYETFITERDFVEIVAAGLNWVRIPIPFFAIEVWEGEPFLPKVSWEYFLKAIKWARKYGLRINLDLHSVPGSQNGWNHSGRQGSVNWLNGVMGLANAQRSLDYVRTLAQFIAQPEYAPVIQMFGFLNEPNGNAISKGPVASFYIEAHNIIRDITGIGAGNGPMLSMHDGFLGVAAWYGDLAGADRMMLDQHTYMVFQDQPQGTLDTLKTMPCQWWASSTNTTSQQWGPNTAGEWSAAWNDCGKWVNNVGSGSRYDGTYDGYADKVTGSCDYWNDYTQWNASTIEALNHFVSGSMDALQNFFFWTWKIGNSTDAIQQPNPFWHYRLGLEKGWIPKDPRTVAGTCQADGVSMNNFDGTFSNAYVTGGAGAGTIAASASSSYPWPPASFTNVASDSISLLPQYTQTGTPITMPGPTFTSPGSTATISAGSGWYNANANDRQAYAAISGCSYPAEYSAADLAIPTGACGAGLSQANKRSAQPTPAPTR